MDPIYVVSGFPRSGTSMMMRCLEAGGIECVYDTRGDANRNKNTLIPGYVPNPHGFYEDAPLNSPDWSAFRGKAVKVVRDNLHLIPPGESLRVVYMTRDPAEIRRSYYGILSGPHDETVYGFLEQYEEKAMGDMSVLCAAGHEVHGMHYARFVFEPHRLLVSLGWPIDAEKAAAAVDPSLYRHRGAA